METAAELRMEQLPRAQELYLKTAAELWMEQLPRVQELCLKTAAALIREQLKCQSRPRTERKARHYSEQPILLRWNRFGMDSLRQLPQQQGCRRQRLSWKKLQS